MFSNYECCYWHLSTSSETKCKEGSKWEEILCGEEIREWRLAALRYDLFTQGFWVVYPLVASRLYVQLKKGLKPVNFVPKE